MAKAKSVYVCAECGGSSPRWMGRCPSCNAWNSLTEQRLRPVGTGGKKARVPVAGGAVAVADVVMDDVARFKSGIEELDRVLGGGIVPGGVVLLGGDPGIGKSTLLMQALAGLASSGRKTLYVTAEESASQVALRATRIVKNALADMKVLATTSLEEAEAVLEAEGPEVVVIDSVQTLRAEDLESAAGTVSQLREVTARLTERAKRQPMAMFLVGHVTKDGSLAGPKVLEHLVDTVLNFEGDASAAVRLLRVSKNRFGDASEVGVFEMVEEGLREVPDPSALFLAERARASSGSVVVATADGARPLLVEVQALVAPAAYGAARRVASGLDANRVAILLAVLDRKAGIHVLDRDVFVSVAGGVRVTERATDLAITLAIVSSLRERPVPEDLVVFGEVGLAGEVRGVPRVIPRLREASKLGYARAIVPERNAKSLKPEDRHGLECISVSTVEAALEVL
ncbi:MAG: DNA repair protein RadA [Myxococcales bacterium]|nr:DNA repair protein RadA [Myxococcales bacterium]